MRFILIILFIRSATAVLTDLDFVPDVAPPIDRPGEFDGVKDFAKRIYIMSLFQKSFYEPRCDITGDVIVQPMYFWPGQRVDLRCVMCRRAFTYNGQVKHWWFMPFKYVEKELADKRNLRNSRNWIKDLSELSVDHRKNKYKTPDRMPSGDETGIRIDKPGVVFVQRDGLLTILQPTPEQEGLYRCLDKASRRSLHFVYYLIAMQPMFIYYQENENKLNKQLSGECPDSAGFPDMNWKFRHVPPTVVRAEPDSICKQNWSYCLQWTLSEHWVKEGKFFNLHSQAESHADVAAKYVNLKIELHWSEWTPCGEGQTVRTREGHCYLKKIDPEKNIQQLSDDLFRNVDIYSWVNEIKNHFNAIQEFKEIGIRLYSGILAKVIGKSATGRMPDDCYSTGGYKDTERGARAKQRWLDAIMSSFKLDYDGLLYQSDRVCLHYYKRPNEFPYEGPLPSYMLIGTHILDTQECPRS